jgi:glutamate racemase
VHALPLLRGAIAGAVGKGVRLVDSAEAVAGEVAEALARGGLVAPTDGGLRLLVTDAAARITRIAHLILPDVAVNLELVDLPD